MALTHADAATITPASIANKLGTRAALRAPAVGGVVLAVSNPVEVRVSVPEVVTIVGAGAGGVIVSTGVSPWVLGPSSLVGGAGSVS
jgi:hypothetical protein